MKKIASSMEYRELIAHLIRPEANDYERVAYSHIRHQQEQIVDLLAQINRLTKLVKKV